jgi:hypothetical protein
VVLLDVVSGLEVHGWGLAMVEQWEGDDGMVKSVARWLNQKSGVGG